MICKGCGVPLQTNDKTAPGYTPKADGEYCQRCFRLIHYDDLTLSMKTGIDPDTVIDHVSQLDALIVYVVDLFDFEAGMIPGLSRKLSGKDMILVASKRDLLPDTLSHEKIASFVFSRLKEYGITIQELVLTSAEKHAGIDEVKAAVKKHRRGRCAAVIGRANSGKSTLLNALSGGKSLTASRYPGTTLGYTELEIDGIQYVDTPGIEIAGSMVMAVKEKDLRTILPRSTVRPAVFQIHEDQSYALGGLARLDVKCGSSATVTWYLSRELYLHRTRLSNADELWKKQTGKLLSPVPTEKKKKKYQFHRDSEKTDVVIDGLGWACISGDAPTLTVEVPAGVNVTFRKAMM